MSTPRSDLSARPTSALVEPQAEQLIPTFVERALTLPELVSPSYWLMTILEEVCGENPFEHGLDRLAGDWEGVSRAAGAVRGLSDFYEVYGDELRSIATELTEGWVGDAANEAHAFLSTLFHQVLAQADALRSVAGDLDRVAFGMDAVIDAFISLLGALLDWSIVAAISAAVGAATASTGVGAVVGAGATALAIAMAASSWVTALGKISDGLLIAKTLTGVLSGYTQGVEGFTAVPLPDGT